MGDGGGVVLGRSVCFPLSCPPSLSIPPSATQDISVKQLVETFANTIQIQIQIQIKYDHFVSILFRASLSVSEIKVKQKSRL